MTSYPDSTVVFCVKPTELVSVLPCRRPSVAREERLGLRVLPQRRHLCDLHQILFLLGLDLSDLFDLDLSDLFGLSSSVTRTSSDVHVRLPPDQYETPPPPRAPTRRRWWWLRWVTAVKPVSGLQGGRTLSPKCETGAIDHGVKSKSLTLLEI